MPIRPAAPAAKVAAAPAKAAAPSTAIKANAITTTKPVQPSASVAGESRITITKTLLENGVIKGEPVVAEDIEVRLFATSTATFAYGKKFRKNIGNYEGVDVSVFASFPCYVEDFDNTAGQVVAKVEELFTQEMTDLDVEAFRGEAMAGTADFGGDGTEAEAQTGEGEAEASGEIDEAWVTAATREEIEAVLVDSPIEDLDPADYPDDEDLKAMVISAWFGDATTEEPVAEGDQPYTEVELMAAPMEDLKALYETWEMGKFPAYTTKNQAVVKKTAVKKILERQEAGAA